MPGRVRQRLAQHGKHLLGQLRAGPRVESAAEPHGRREAQHLGHLVDQADDVRPQPRPGGLPPGLQREDRRPDVPDRVVHGVDGVAHPVGHLVPGDHGHHALQRHAGGVQPLDDQVVQVPGDPVPVLEHRQLLGVGPAGRQFQRDRRLRGEGGDHALGALRQRQFALAAGHGQHAAHVAGRAEREQHGGPDVPHRAPGDLGGPLVDREVLHRDRLAGGEHLAGQRPAGREHQSPGLGGAVPLRVLHGEPAAVLVGQRERHQVRTGQLERLPGQVAEHRRGRGPGEQRDRQLAARPQPALLPGGLLIQPGVLHRDAGRGAERGDHGLVVLGELAAAALLRQVQVAEDLVPDPDRNAEKGPHGRVPGRESGRILVRRDVRKPQRVRILDQQPEQAASLGPVVDLRDLVGAEPDRDELDQLLPFADHAEGAVPGIHQLYGRLDDPAQHRLQVEPRADRDDRLEQSVHPVPGREHRLEPHLQLRQQVVEPELRQNATTLVFHAGKPSATAIMAESPDPTRDMAPTFAATRDRIVAIGNRIDVVSAGMSVRG